MRLEWVAVAALLGAGAVSAADTPQKFGDFIMRGNLMRSYARLSAGGSARVAFMGGSVTCGGWREPLMKWLRERFPNTQFDFIMAGVGGTDANLGAFRLPRDVFSHGKVDLFFLEFAVNGGGVRAMEGIVRQAKRLNPDIDIMLTYFASTGHCASFDKGQVPGIVQQHEQVAAHYGLPSLWFYREVAQRIKAGRMKWADFSGDSVHPNAFGYGLYAQWYESFLDQAWADTSLKPAALTMPAALDPLCYQQAHFVDPAQATLTRGFALVKGWTAEKTCNYGGPVDVLTATEPGAEMAFKFKGTAVGMYMIAGFDAGVIEYAIDGQPFKSVDLFDMPWCTMFHRPVHRLLSDTLSGGEHTLVVRMTDKQHEKSTGHAVRILQFMVNGG